MAQSGHPDTLNQCPLLGRFQHRMPSRAAAVREPLRHGIGAIGVVMENAGVRSGDYGVLKAAKGVGPARKDK